MKLKKALNYISCKEKIYLDDVDNPKVILNNENGNSITELEFCKYIDLPVLGIENFKDGLLLTLDGTGEYCDETDFDVSELEDMSDMIFDYIEDLEGLMKNNTDPSYNTYYQRKINKAKDLVTKIDNIIEQEQW